MKKEKPLYKDWLENLQQESWRLELIISGIAILALINGISYVEDWSNSLTEQYSEDHLNSIFLFEMALIAVEVSFYIALINLIIHVLTRSLWIGAIGLRYVSGDINYEKINYHPRFINYYKKRIGSFDRYIERLEDFSSIIFAYTFLLCFIVISCFFFLFLFFGSFFVVMEMLPIGLTKSILLIGIILSFLGSIIILLDFITLGSLKRIKNRYFSFIYFWIYRFYSTVTLSFLWRPMLLNFLDQVYTKRLVMTIIPYFIFSLFISGLRYSSNGFYPDYEQVANEERQIIFGFNPQFYDEERKKYPKDASVNGMGPYTLPSIILQGNLGQIFIRAIHEDKHLIEHQDSTLTLFEEDGFHHESSIILDEFNEGFQDGQIDGQRAAALASLDTINNRNVYLIKRDSINTVFDKKISLLEKQQEKQNAEKIRNILEKSVSLSVDEQPISSERKYCDFYNHPDDNVKGLLCFFPLEELTTGKHTLKVGKVKGIKEGAWSGDTTLIRLDTTYQEIPFIYQL